MIKRLLVYLLRRIEAPELFLRFALRAYRTLYKGVYLMPDPCKTDHGKVETRHCPECGDQVQDPEMDAVADRVAGKVIKLLESEGIIKRPKKAGDPDPVPEKKPSIADRFLGKSKKKESEK